MTTAQPRWSCSVTVKIALKDLGGKQQLEEPSSLWEETTFPKGFRGEIATWHEYSSCVGLPAAPSGESGAGLRLP